MHCHQCGACCTEISISSHIPGQGPKPAGVACVHLKNNLCSLFGQPNRPKVCSTFNAAPDICGSTQEEAVALIRIYEKETSPTR